MKKLLLPGIALGLFAAALWFTACQKETPNSITQGVETAASDRSNGSAYVFPRSAHPYGKSYEEWTAIWLQKFMVFDCAHNPWLNPSQVLFNETGPVYFIAGISQVGGSVNITVPHGKAILFPLVNYINDYPCPSEYNFEPGPGQTLEEFLTEGAVSAMSGVINQAVTIDGAAVCDAASYKFTTSLFHFTGHPDLSNCFDVCVTGTSQPAVGCGYYMMLKPLSKGQHTVHYHMEIPSWGAVQDGTFNITVP